MIVIYEDLDLFSFPGSMSAMKKEEGDGEKVAAEQNWSGNVKVEDGSALDGASVGGKEGGGDMLEEKEMGKSGGESDFVLRCPVEVKACCVELGEL